MEETKTMIEKDGTFEEVSLREIRDEKNKKSISLLKHASELQNQRNEENRNISEKFKVQVEDKNKSVGLLSKVLGGI